MKPLLLALAGLSSGTPLRETVRDIRDGIKHRSFVYTTILTIMTRLHRKRLVTRRKAYGAFVYSAVLSHEDARADAVDYVVTKYFDGDGATRCPPFPLETEIMSTFFYLDKTSEVRYPD